MDGESEIMRLGFIEIEKMRLGLLNWFSWHRSDFQTEVGMKRLVLKSKQSHGLNLVRQETVNPH